MSENSTLTPAALEAAMEAAMYDFAICEFNYKGQKWVGEIECIRNPGYNIYTGTTKELSFVFYTTDSEGNPVPEGHNGWLLTMKDVTDFKVI